MIDSRGWGLADQEGAIDLRGVQTWEELYLPATSLGFNQNPACRTCPFLGCGAHATENPVAARGKKGMSAKDRTRVRIFACFNNLRTCEAHVAAIKAELEEFANRASHDVIRELMKVQPADYSARDIARLKVPLMGVIGYWQRIPLVAGPWMHQSAKNLRATLSWFAERIALRAQISSRTISKKGTLDDEKWAEEFADMQREIQVLVNEEQQAADLAAAAQAGHQPQQQYASSAGYSSPYVSAQHQQSVSPTPTHTHTHTHTNTHTSNHSNNHLHLHSHNHSNHNR